MLSVQQPGPVVREASERTQSRTSDVSKAVRNPEKLQESQNETYPVAIVHVQVLLHRVCSKCIRLRVERYHVISSCTVNNVYIYICRIEYNYSTGVLLSYPSLDE